MQDGVAVAAVAEVGRPGRPGRLRAEYPREKAVHRIHSRRQPRVEQPERVRRTGQRRGVAVHAMCRQLRRHRLAPAREARHAARHEQYRWTVLPGMGERRGLAPQRRLFGIAPAKPGAGRGRLLGRVVLITQRLLRGEVGQAIDVDHGAQRLRLGHADQGRNLAASRGAGDRHPRRIDAEAGRVGAQPAQRFLDVVDRRWIARLARQPIADRGRRIAARRQPRGKRRQIRAFAATPAAAMRQQHQGRRRRARTGHVQVEPQGQLAALRIHQVLAHGHRRGCLGAGDADEGIVARQLVVSGRRVVRRLGACRGAGKRQQQAGCQPLHSAAPRNVQRRCKLAPGASTVRPGRPGRLWAFTGWSTGSKQKKSRPGGTYRMK